MMKRKNKATTEKERLKAHKAQRQTAKARRTEPLLTRPEPTREEKQTFLIYCEGKNTEPSYFRQFRLASATITSFGEGRNTISLVERAKALAAQEEEYDQVWCVFDADPKPDNSYQAKNFNAAIDLAKRYGFHIAYSNQAFEYWLILHFEDHQGGKMDRADYNDKLNHYFRPLGCEFDGKGSKIVTEEMFMELDNRREVAIRRAKKIYSEFEHNNPAAEESSTTVFQLVEEILRYIR
jgi:hypothetical protein